MLTDALLAWLHYLLIFALSGCLIAEFAFYRATLERDVLERLARVDLAYGILAGLIIVSGILRVIYSPKGSAYYLHDTIFWTKMTLFLIVALLSIPPTVHYIRLRGAIGNAATVTIARTTYVRMRALLAAEAFVLVLIPLCASLMARGYGYAG